MQLPLETPTQDLIGMQDSSIRAVDTPHHDIFGDAITTLQADAAASTLRVIHPDDESGVLQIDADIECDTFFPELKPGDWRMWSQSAPKRDNGMRYSFQCYVPASASSTSNRPPDLPAGLAAQHEEYQVDLDHLLHSTGSCGWHCHTSMPDSLPGCGSKSNTIIMRKRMCLHALAWHGLDEQADS